MEAIEAEVPGYSSAAEWDSKLEANLFFQKTRVLLPRLPWQLANSCLKMTADNWLTPVSRGPVLSSGFCRHQVLMISVHGRTAAALNCWAISSTPLSYSKKLLFPFLYFFFFLRQCLMFPGCFPTCRQNILLLKKHHAQDNLQKKAFNWASSSRGLVSVMAEQVSEQGQLIALVSTHNHKVERTSLKWLLHTSKRTSSNKTKPPNLPPTVPPNGDQVSNQMPFGGHSHANHHILITLNKYI